MRGGELRALLRETWFPALYGTRLVSQCADGILQASLASAVFFNPDHQTDPKRAAAGFVVLLLPYSLVGPFAGVFLDRWRRQRVLVLANIVRSVFVVLTAALLLGTGPQGIAFYVAALAAVSVNRFYLSALSAALPHVVAPSRLLLANSVTTTSGTFIAIVGAGIGLAVRHLGGEGDEGSAIIAGTAAVVYLLAASVASRMPRDLLGPDDRTSRSQVWAALAAVGRGLVDGARHVRAHRHAARALLAMSATRLLFGMSTIGTLLLYRNYFHDQGLLRAGLVGLAQAFAVAALGYVAGAVVTPAATARMGKQRWIVNMFALTAVVTIAFGLPFRMAPLLVGAGLLGFTTQAAKICVDTIVQEDIDDDFRGRVFSFYDTLFNASFVVAAVLAAFVLPANGRSLPVLLAIGGGYAVTAVAYGVSEWPRRTRLTASATAGAQT